MLGVGTPFLEVGDNWFRLRIEVARLSTDLCNKTPLPPLDAVHESKITPAKPSEALLEKLAKSKGLDPKTGRPSGAEHS